MLELSKTTARVERRGNFPARRLNQHYPGRGPRLSMNDLLREEKVRRWCMQTEEDLSDHLDFDFSEAELKTAGVSIGDRKEVLNAARPRLCTIALNRARRAIDKNNAQDDNRRIVMPRDLPELKRIMEAEAIIWDRLPDRSDEEFYNAILTVNQLRTREKSMTRYMQMTRPERAKKHLDRARQMWSAGSQKVHKAMNPDPTPAARGGLKLIYNTDGAIHRAGKRSASSELLAAYLLLRDFEVYPSPPLVPVSSVAEWPESLARHLGVAGEVVNDKWVQERAPAGVTVMPNPMRVREEQAYAFIMGTARMSPNRLSLGMQASDIWYTCAASGHPFYAYCIGAVNRHSVPVSNAEKPYESIISMPDGNEPPIDRNGPELALVWNEFSENMSHQEIVAFTRPVEGKRALGPLPRLIRRGVLPRSEWPDMAHALTDVHLHLLQDRVLLEDSNRDELDKESLPTNLDVENAPIVLGSNFTQINEAEPGTNRALDQLITNTEPRTLWYFPVVQFGSSESDQIPDQKGQIEPLDEFAIPNWEDFQWDCRVSLGFLRSEKEQFRMQTHQYALSRQTMQTSAGRDRLRPAGAWHAGPQMLSTFHRLFSPKEIAEWKASDDGSEYTNKAWGITLGETDFRRLRDGFRYQTLGVAAPRRRGIDPGTLSPDVTAHILDHALYQLSAPSVLNTAAIPEGFRIQADLDGHSNLPLQGIYRRNGDGMLQLPPARGFATYDETDVIGPLTLDPEFGEVNHMPGPDYAEAVGWIRGVYVRKLADGHLETVMLNDDDENGGEGEGDGELGPGPGPRPGPGPAPGPSPNDDEDWDGGDEFRRGDHESGSPPHGPLEVEGDEKEYSSIVGMVDSVNSDEKRDASLEREWQALNTTLEQKGLKLTIRDMASGFVDDRAQVRNLVRDYCVRVPERTDKRMDEAKWLSRNIYDAKRGYWISIAAAADASAQPIVFCYIRPWTYESLTTRHSDVKLNKSITDLLSSAKKRATNETKRRTAARVKAAGGVLGDEDAGDLADDIVTTKDVIIQNDLLPLNPPFERVLHFDSWMAGGVPYTGKNGAAEKPSVGLSAWSGASYAQFGAKDLLPEPLWNGVAPVAGAEQVVAAENADVKREVAGRSAPEAMRSLANRTNIMEVVLLCAKPKSGVADLGATALRAGLLLSSHLGADRAILDVAHFSKAASIPRMVELYAKAGFGSVAPTMRAPSDEPRMLKFLGEWNGRSGGDAGANTAYLMGTESREFQISLAGNTRLYLYVGTLPHFMMRGPAANGLLVS